MVAVPFWPFEGKLRVLFIFGLVLLVDASELIADAVEDGFVEVQGVRVLELAATQLDDQVGQLSVFDDLGQHVGFD